MAKIRVKRFGEGMADDMYAAGPGQFSVAKHFDTIGYPNRLFPLRGMTSDTASTGIGNVIVGSDGNFYGVGGDYMNSAPTNSAIWKRTTGWAQFTHTTGDPVSYNLLVEYHDSSGNRLFITAATNNKLILTRMDDSAVTTHALTFTNVAQGVVHPEDDICYIPYDNKIAANNNGTWTDAAFTAPANYRITSVVPDGTFLSISLTPSVNGVDYGGSGANSIVYKWNRDTSVSTVTENIDWSTGRLKYLGKLDGVLIGISETGGNSSNVLDRDSIQISYHDGTRPVPLLEISTDKQTSTIPSVNINPRVRFKHNKRLYFSIDVAGGSTSPSLHGLFSIGRSKSTGRFSVNLERVATDDNSETAVLAAAISGDKCLMVYNAEGTLSITNSTSGTGAQYTATSDYQSAVNPQMLQEHPDDFDQEKLLTGVAAYFRPLTSSGQVVMQYRVDGGAWTTIFTKTSTSPDTKLTYFEATLDATGSQFTQGTYYEFRLKSTGGAQILGYAYEYKLATTQL